MSDKRGRLIHSTRDDEGTLEVFDDGITRSLYFGNDAKQSSVLLCDPAVMVLRYTRSMLSTLLFKPEPASVLMIGLGGGSLASFLIKRLPRCKVDVVESRDAVVRLAREYFFLPDDERLHIHVGDGAAFLAACKPHIRYDLILIDAFDDSGMVPLLEQADFLHTCRQRLSSDGMLAANLWVTRTSRWRPALNSLYAHFGPNSFELPVTERGNLVALGLQQACGAESWPLLEKRAQSLEQHYGLNFREMLAALRPVRKPGLWDRLRGMSPA